MAKFLTRDEIYRLLQRELPEGVYPDGSPEKYYSTADMASVADVVASGYDNAKKIYDNYFPRTATEQLTKWEKFAFGIELDKSLSIQVRRDRVEQKIRARKGITKQDIKDVVLGVLGTDKVVEVVAFNNADNAWFLNLSELGIETYLSGLSSTYPTQIDPCETDFAQFSLSEDEWNLLKEEAYTYEVKIYGYKLTPLEVIELNIALDDAEPFRCNRIITDGLNPENIGGQNFTGFTNLLSENDVILLAEGVFFQLLTQTGDRLLTENNEIIDVKINSTPMGLG